MTKEIDDFIEELAVRLAAHPTLKTMTFSCMPAGPTDHFRSYFTIMEGDKEVRRVQMPYVFTDLLHFDLMDLNKDCSDLVAILLIFEIADSIRQSSIETLREDLIELEMIDEQ